VADTPFRAKVFRTKTVSTKVTEKEFAEVEALAAERGVSLSEWCREVLLRERGRVAGGDPTLAEIVGVRLLLVNVLRPLAAGEKMTHEAFDKLLDQIQDIKYQLAATLQEAAQKKSQREESGDGKR
jgi:hypothetical protein